MKSRAPIAEASRGASPTARTARNRWASSAMAAPEPRGAATGRPREEQGVPLRLGEERERDGHGPWPTRTPSAPAASKSFSMRAFGDSLGNTPNSDSKKIGTGSPGSMASSKHLLLDHGRHVWSRQRRRAAHGGSARRPHSPRRAAFAGGLDPLGVGGAPPRRSLALAPVGSAKPCGNHSRNSAIPARDPGGSRRERSDRSWKEVSPCSRAFGSTPVP